MKKTKSKLVFGAVVVACFAAARCGGDDSNSALTGGTSGNSSGAAGSSGSANSAGSADTGGTTGMGGSANSAGTVNNGGSVNNAGAANNAGTNNGGNVTPTDAGGGTAGGPQVGGDAGMCPAMAPMNNSMCEGNVVCDYPGAQETRACACRPTIGRLPDGGARPRQWACGNIPNPRDAGGGNPTDGGVTVCPNGTMDGNRCTVQLEICREGRNTTCVCVPAANNDEWACN